MKKIKNIILILGLSFLSFSFVSDYFEISKNIEIFNAVYREINMFYVEEVKPGKLMKKAINSGGRSDSCSAFWTANNKNCSREFITTQ